MLILTRSAFHTQAIPRLKITYAQVAAVPPPVLRFPDGTTFRACFENHAGLLAKRRTMSRIIASFSRVSLVWTLRS